MSINQINSFGGCLSLTMIVVLIATCVSFAVGLGGWAFSGGNDVVLAVQVGVITWLFCVATPFAFLLGIAAFEVFGRTFSYYLRDFRENFWKNISKLWV